MQIDTHLYDLHQSDASWFYCSLAASILNYRIRMYGRVQLASKQFSDLLMQSFTLFPSLIFVLVLLFSKSIFQHYFRGRFACNQFFSLLILSSVQCRLLGQAVDIFKNDIENCLHSRVSFVFRQRVPVFHVHSSRLERYGFSSLRNSAYCFLFVFLSFPCIIFIIMCIYFRGISHSVLWGTRVHSQRRTKFRNVALEEVFSRSLGLQASLSRLIFRLFCV